MDQAPSTGARMGNRHVVRRDRPAPPWVRPEVPLGAGVRFHVHVHVRSCWQCPTDSYQPFWVPQSSHVYRGTQGLSRRRCGHDHDHVHKAGRCESALSAARFGRESTQGNRGRKMRQPPSKEHSTQRRMDAGGDVAARSVAAQRDGGLRRWRVRFLAGFLFPKHLMEVGGQMDTWSMRNRMGGKKESRASMLIRVGRLTSLPVVYGRQSVNQGLHGWTTARADSHQHCGPLGG